MSTFTLNEMQGQHQPVMSKPVKEMEAVVGHHPPSYCESEWSVIGNKGGMGGSYCDGV